MKLVLAGVVYKSGTSKAGKPFSFSQAICLVPFSPVNSKNYQSSGLGFEVAVMPMADGLISSFQSLKFPCQVEVTMDQRLINGRLESYVTGYKEVPRVAAA